MGLLLLAACQDRSSVGASAAEAQAIATTPPPGKGTPAQNLANAYLVLQAKLAVDDFAGARAACAGVRSAAQVPALALTPELKKKIETASVECGAAPDIARLRTLFAGLSDAMLAYFAAQPNPLPVGLGVAHCPMAMDGKGAKWLQTGDSLRNPYFGAEMLTCGTLESTVKPGKKSGS
jgi:Cu(I)/Ag(I) efflux system membrane fusion protein